MTEIVAATGVEQASKQMSQMGQPEPASREIVSLFEHLLGQKIDQPSGLPKETIARMLANPTTLGDHILANVEGMHQTFKDFSAQIEDQLTPPGAEGMSLGADSADRPDNGGVFADLANSAESVPGPASQMPASEDGKGIVPNGYDGWQSEMQELLWVQYNVGKILVHEEMMSKAAGKSTQNLDMLLRGQ